MNTMELTDIATQMIDDWKVVAVAVRTVSHKGAGEIAYALTQKRLTPGMLSGSRLTGEILLSSRALSAIGWDYETGGMNVKCWPEAVDGNIADWAEDFRSNGYEVELR